jgi:hypothetical protein
VDAGRIVAGGLIVLVSGLFLVYGLRFQSIYLLTRGSVAGMKDRSTQPLMYWAGVAEWSVFALSGIGVIAAGLFNYPDVR